ncbi:extracellular solute-binding protein [Vagococcus sp. BWB3-3]|uniref:Extracellular solute-binding protein n=1 Tax=Vagococcus allomyrinae TaxID=2794353 RepID=A0A940SR05_9ENTE|nr:extracellular solute-binding protein [Vagococcus allomyrinae]MBP1040272.1 extracellular solute-binding protein [Vagococcus allomyrinae]
MKKFIGLMVIGLTALMVLSGCGDQKEQETSSGTKETLTVMASGVKNGTQGVFLEQFKQMVEKEYPELTVETTLLPDDQYLTALKSKLSTGQAPDLFLVQPKKASANSVEELAKAGYLEDLSDLENWDKIKDQGKNDMSFEGKPYALSSSISVLGTWYNKDLFKQHKIDLPTNWQAFLAACETLKQAGVTPIVMGDKDSFMIQFGMYQVAANQVYPSNPQFDDQLYTGETKLTDDVWVKTVTMYNELYKKGYVTDKSLGLGQPQAQQSFVDQEAAMIFDGDFSLTAIENDNFDLGFMAMPANEEGETYLSAATGAGYAISKKSQHKETLKAVFNKMTDGQSEMFTNWLATATSFTTYAEGDDLNPVFEEIVPAFEAGRSFYWSNQAWPSGTETEMQAKFSEMIGAGKLKPIDVTEAMQKKFEELTK